MLALLTALPASGAPGGSTGPGPSAGSGDPGAAPAPPAPVSSDRPSAVPADSLIASGPTDSEAIVVLDCRSGAVRARVRTPAPLGAPVVADFAAGALYAVTRPGELLRYSLPGLTLQARQALAFEPTALGASRGPDALVLAGGRGATPLSAHDPDTLAVLMRYPSDGPAQVAAVLDVAPRGRFVVGFADRPELWEIAYDRNAPAVLRGLVHDYRMGEAVTLPGRLTSRPFAVPSASRELVAGASAFELLRVDTDGLPGVVNLDVRREIEHPRIGTLPRTVAAQAWSADNRRGWLIANAHGPARVVEAPNWRVSTFELGGAALALGPGARPGESSVLIRAPKGTELLRVDAAGAQVLRRVRLPAAATGAQRIAAGSDGQCVALLDGQGHWVGRSDGSP